MSEANTQENAVLARVKPLLEGIDHRTEITLDGTLCLLVGRENTLGVLRALKDQAGFESVTFVTGVDHHPATPRFEVAHQLHSLQHCERIRVRTALEEDAASLSSCVSLWPGAGFMERECYDMFGIVFEGHPNLKRLLMPDGYGHHPLRKEFPHHGIEPDRLYREWDAQRRQGWDPEA